LKSITVKPTPRKHSAKEAPILRQYLLEALRDSNANPPDTEYQRGFLGALLVLFEDLCMTESEREQHLIMGTAMKDRIRQPDSTLANRSRRSSYTRSGARTTE
jgi:hypothetical protein